LGRHFLSVVGETFHNLIELLIYKADGLDYFGNLGIKVLGYSYGKGFYLFGKFVWMVVILELMVLFISDVIVAKICLQGFCVKL